MPCMAFAVRRLVLRSKSFNCQHPIKTVAHTALICASGTCRRSFYQTAWLAKDSGDSIKDGSKSATQKSGSHEPCDSSSNENKVTIEQIDTMNRSAAWVQFEAALSRTQDELGHDLNEAERDAFVSDYMQTLIASGEVDRTMEFMEAMGIAENELQQMKSMLLNVQKIQAEEESYEELSDALEAADDDPAALEAIFKKTEIDSAQLESGAIDRAAFKKISEYPELKAVKDPDEVERVVWEQLQKMEGMSDADIAADRQNEEIESMMVGLDPGAGAKPTRAALSSDDSASFTSIANDHALFRKMEREGSLHELSRRLGWTDDQGNIVSGDLLTFYRIVENVDPEKRRILLSLMKTDESFASQLLCPDEADPAALKPERVKPGFWNIGDVPELGEDEVFQDDDMPRAGHQDLELKREIREYARWTVWELPLLSKLARPYQPPKADQVLHFRYTTYLGEQHPAEKKVVVEFSPLRLDLTDIQRSKLIKIAGVRYNPDTEMVKISCESFETPAQNKRYLANLVEILIKEAKDAKDTFEDLPLDFRHHKPKVFHTFPEAWILTPERKAELLARRQQDRVLEQMREQKQGIIDGKMFLPGGVEGRQQQATNHTRIRNEDLAIQEQGLTQRERDALTAARMKHQQAEAKKVAADIMARRPSKRDAKTEHMVRLRRERLAYEQATMLSYARNKPSEISPT